MEIERENASNSGKGNAENLYVLDNQFYRNIFPSCKYM